MNIPKGYKLVPVEPTDQMLGDAMDAYSEMDGKRHRFSSTLRPVYSAMLAAAPAPPQPIYDEAAELERFSIQWKLEGRIYRDKNTHQWLPTRDTIEGFQMAERVHALWMGWQSCTQSRAKAGEDE